MRLLEVSEQAAEDGADHNRQRELTSADTQPFPVFPGLSDTLQAHPAAPPQHPAAVPASVEAPAPAPGGGHPLVRCCVCKRVKGEPRHVILKGSTRASDGICPDCWGPYRHSLGLPVRPYTGGAW